MERYYVPQPCGYLVRLRGRADWRLPGVTHRACNKPTKYGLAFCLRHDKVIRRALNFPDFKSTYISAKAR